MSPVASSAPAGARSLRPALVRQRSARYDYAVSALVVAALAVAAFVLGRLRASSLPEASSARQQLPPPAASSSPVALPASVGAEASPLERQPSELGLIPFVPIEVEPAHGEIWLDREVAGVGSVQLGAIDDGMLHELRFVAPEHETKTLFFRNTPPAGRVILKRIDPQQTPAPRAPARAARNESAAGQPRAAASGANTDGRADPEPDTRVARGGPAAARPVARARPTADEAASDVSAGPRKAPRVQLIEVHMPRVEVLD